MQQGIMKLNAVTFAESESSIINYIEGLGSPADFNILCGTTIFKAHRTIFGASSNYLLELFMKEPDGFFNIILDEVETIDVENLLTYVYQAKVGVKPSQTHGFLRAAKQLKIDTLMQHSSDVLGAFGPGVTNALDGPRTEPQDSNVRADMILQKPTVQTATLPYPKGLKIREPPAVKSCKAFINKTPCLIGSTNPYEPEPTLARNLAASISQRLHNIREARIGSDDVQILAQVRGSVTKAKQFVENPAVIVGERVSKRSKTNKKLPPIALDTDEDFNAFKVPFPKQTKMPVQKVPNKVVQATLHKNLNDSIQSDMKVTTARPISKRKIKMKQKPGNPNDLKRFENQSLSESEPVNQPDQIQLPLSPKLIESSSQLVLACPVIPVLPIDSVVNVRGVLGRPILSSTKLDPSNPVIPDKVKPGDKGTSKINQKDANGSTRFFNTLKSPDQNFQGNTFIVPETPLENFNPVKRQEGRALGKDRQPIHQGPRFCVTDLVKEIEKKKGLNQSISSESDEPKVVAEVKNSNKVQRVKGQGKRVAVKKVPVKRLKRKLPQNMLSTTEEHYLVDVRRNDKIRATVQPVVSGVVANLVQATDDSSDCVQVIGEIRKKLPIAKRRRVPASTRAMICNSTTGITSTSMRKSLQIRNKYLRNKINRRHPVCI